MNDALSANAARGAMYVIAGQLARTALLFVSTVVLSRLLAPNDFGLMAISLSVVALGELIRDSGLALAVARDVPLSGAQKSNLFWINLLLGIGTAAATFALAPLLSSWMSQPALLPLLQALSFALLLSGYSTQFRAEINRQMRFFVLALVDTLPAAVGLVVAVVWAVFDPSVAALAAQQLITAGAGALMATLLAKWLPGLPSRAPVRSFLTFGLGLLGTQGLAYAARNADNYLIAAAWGTTALGYYSRAYQLLMAPLNQLLAPLTRVAVPVLSRSTNDARTFNRRLRAAQLAAGAPLAVLYAVLSGLATPLVFFLLGDQWDAAAPIFQALCIGGIFKALNQATYWVFVSTGRTSTLLASYLVTQPLIVLCMAAGLPWGATGVAWGHSVGYAAAWAISLTWCARTTLLDGRAMVGQAVVVLLYFALPIGALSFAATHVPSPAGVQILVALVSGGLWFAVVTIFVPGARTAVRSATSSILLTVRRRRA